MHIYCFICRFGMFVLYLQSNFQSKITSYMKKSLLFVVAAALTLPLMAQLPVRSTGGAMRKITDRSAGHAALQARPFQIVAPMSEAPENAIEVPFKHSLGKNEKEVMDQYTIVDADNDTKTWKPGGFTTYSVCMKPTADDVVANDDWMISVPVHFEAGKTYRLGIEVGRTLSSGSEDKLEICYGEGTTPEAMTGKIGETLVITNRDFEKKEIDFEVAADGYYNVGLHCISEKAKSGNLKVCNLEIGLATPKLTPAAAGELSYELAPKGELKAFVKYTAPTKDTEGNAIEENLTVVKVKTNWIETHSFEDVAPGSTIEFETSLYNNANNKIEATAYRYDVAGETAIIDRFFAGPDEPSPVENLTITLADDYKSVTLKWDPVGDKGAHGGYVDAENIVYYVFDAFGSYYDPAIAETDKTEVTIDFADFEGQDFVSYQVTAGCGYYYSVERTSDIVCVGTPDSMPWMESFGNGYYGQAWVIDPESDYYSFMTGIFLDNELQTNTDDENAAPEYLNSHDGDNGFFLFLPTEKDALYGFYSQKIDISKAANPVFEFFYQGQGSELSAMLAVDGAPIAPVKTIDLKENPTSDWTLCRIDLAPYKNNKYIQVGLQVVAVHNDDEHSWSVPVDNIRIIDLVDNDLRVSALSAPSKVKGGEEFAVEASIENMGSAACNGAVAQLIANGNVVASKELPALAANAVAKVAFSYKASVVDENGIELAVKVVSEGDSNADNDLAKASVAVAVPEYPAVENLQAVAGGNGVALSWQAPSLAGLADPYEVVEDFESEEYEPLTIDNFGGWIMVDADGKKTYTFMGDTQNPYRATPMAYQLYNPVVAGVDDSRIIDATPNSGSTMLVAWSAQGLNDNWLISPVLSGNAQTISFYARSFTIAYAESFEVYYSTGSVDPADFVLVEGASCDYVPEVWTKYTAALPEGALRFAIRHTSYDTYAMYLDDITFEAGSSIPADLAVTGYNVYRDGVLVNAAPVADTAFNDAPAAGTHAYRVSAVYNYGEGKACEPVEVTVGATGIDAVGSAAVRISAAEGCVIVEGAAGEAISIVSVDGKTVFATESAAAAETISLAPGIYVVKAAGTVAKTIVR